MSVFTLLSKKEQVAEIIKSHILEGKIPSGTRLGSVRELAAKFSVCSKSIIDAFDILEKERFIRREAGRGVFVRKNEESAVIETGILGTRVNTVKDEYFNFLAGIALPPYLREGFNFTVRTIPFSADMPERNFEDEFQRLAKQMNADCVLLNAPPISRKQIEFCLRQKTPVIFIGDFSEGLYDDLSFNQVTGDKQSVRKKSHTRNGAIGKVAGHNTVFRLGGTLFQPDFPRRRKRSRKGKRSEDSHSRISQRHIIVYTGEKKSRNLQG